MIRYYCWIASNQEYANFTRGRRAAVPLLDPGDSFRKASWARILEWYGLQHLLAGKSDFSSNEPGGLRREQDPVIVLDDATENIAAYYARMRGRSLVCAKNGVDFERFLRTASADYRSALFFGMAPTFSASYVHRMAKALEIPWGLITSIDLPGITFLTAKMLAGTLTRDSAFVSAIDWPDALAPAGDCYASRALEPQALVSLLTEKDWDTLTIHAHGESGHIDLDSVVLCGLIGESEAGPHGVFPGGCSIKAGFEFCKRSSHASVRVVPVRFIRARRLCVLACNAFSVARDLYPSNVSIFLAGAEGYQSAIAGWDRALPVNGRSFSLLERLIAQSVDFGALQLVENDQREFQDNSRPFIILGDPIAAPLPLQSLECDGTVIPNPAPRPTLVRLDNFAAKPILALEPDCSSRLSRGRLYGAVITPEAPSSTHRVRITDGSPYLASIVNWAGSFSARLHAVRVLQDSLESHFVQARLADREARRCLSGTRIAVRRLATLLLSITRSTNLSAIQGVLEPQLRLAPEILHTCLQFWDRQAAIGIQRIWLQEQFDEILLGGFARRHRWAAGICESVGANLTKSNGPH